MIRKNLKLIEGNLNYFISSVEVESNIVGVELTGIIYTEVGNYELKFNLGDISNKVKDLPLVFKTEVTDKKRTDEKRTDEKRTDEQFPVMITQFSEETTEDQAPAMIAQFSEPKLEPIRKIVKKETKKIVKKEEQQKEEQQKFDIKTSKEEFLKEAIPITTSESFINTINDKISEEVIDLTLPDDLPF